MKVSTKVEGYIDSIFVVWADFIKSCGFGGLRSPLALRVRAMMLMECCARELISQMECLFLGSSLLSGLLGGLLGGGLLF